MLATSCRGHGHGATGALTAPAMPIGNVPMSDGRVGAQMHGSTRVPEPLVRPYDGGLAYKAASMAALQVLALACR